MESSRTAAPVTQRMVEIAGIVYNPDHIVKIDLRKAPEFATIHHTTGADEYSGQDAAAIARFFGPAQGAAPESNPALEPANNTSDKSRRERGKKASRV